ncbi:hypothetical protein ABK040_014695 [Willaertia magna]
MFLGVLKLSFFSILILGLLWFYTYPLNFWEVNKCFDSSIRNARAKLHYERFGNPNATTKMILVIGLGTGWGWWQKQVDFLLQNSTCYNNIEMLVLDNRGTGQTEELPCQFAYTMNDMALDTYSLLEQLNWIGNNTNYNLHIVGQSMGGLILNEMVRIEKSLFPNREKSYFSTVTLQNTFRTTWSSHGFVMLDTIIFFGKTIFSRFLSVEKRMEIVFQQMFSPNHVTTNFTQLMETYSKLFKRDQLFGTIKQTLGITLHYQSEQSFMESYKRIPKILLISSKIDRMVRGSNTRHMYDLLTSNNSNHTVILVKEFENGHIINAEQHETFNEFLFSNILE